MAALEVVARSKRLKKLNLEALGNADIFTYVLCENCQNLQHLGKVSPPKSPTLLLVQCKLFASICHNNQNDLTMKFFCKDCKIEERQ